MMAMNMRCRDQSWSGRAVDCFDIGIECGREIHGENEVLLKFKFCEGKGVCVHVGRFGEMMGDDDDDVMKCFLYNSNIVR